MATIQEATRRLTIESQTRGVNETTDQLKRLADAQDGVATASQRTERSTVSLERRMDAIQRKYDEAYRAQSDLARLEKELSAGQAQGLLTAQRRLEVLSMAAERHGLATAAINREADATDRLASSQRRALVTMQAANQNRAHSVNLGFQAQDILVTSMMGMDARMIAMGQGMQIAGIVQQMGGGASAAVAFKDALLGLISPASLAAVAITGLAATAIQYFMRGEETIKTFDDALKVHSTTVDLLRSRYGGLGDAIAAITPSGAALTAASVRENMAMMEAVQRNLTSGLMGKLEDNEGWTRAWGMFASDGVAALRGLGGDQRQFAAPVERFLQSIRDGSPKVAEFEAEVESLFSVLVGRSENPAALRTTADAILSMGAAAVEVGGKFSPFAKEISRLRLEVADGLVPDIGRAIRHMDEMARADPGLRKLADDAIIAARELYELSQRMRELADMQRRAEAGQRGFIIGSPEEAARNAYLDRQRLAMREMQKSFDADMLAMGARSPAQLAAAARAREEARTVEGESGPERNLRVELAGKRALAEAEHRLTEAREERQRSLDKSLASQQMEISLIGQTAAEAARLRMEFELTAQLREAAARAGAQADEAELALIREKAREAGKYAEALARGRLRDDLMFDMSQRGRSSVDQQIAARLRGSGLSIDMNSPEARLMRENIYADLFKQAISSFVSDFRSALLNNGGDIGDALGQAVMNAALRGLDKMLEQQIANLASALSSKMFGGSGLLSNSFQATTSLGAVLGYSPAANQNTPVAANTNLGGVSGQVWNFFAEKGLQPHQIAGIMGNVRAESNFNPNAIGDGGRAFGLFQHWGNRGGGPGMLGDTQGQLDLAWRELQTTERRAFDQLMSSRNVREATAAFGGFERPKGFAWNNPEAMHNWQGRLSAAENALTQFGRTTTRATQNLGEFGGGLGQLGKALTSGGASGANSVGGLLGGLIQLIGGILFDTGGYTGSGDPSAPAGVVHKDEFVFSSRATRNIGVAALEAMHRAAMTGQGFASGGYGGYGGGSRPAVPPTWTPPSAANVLAGLHVTWGWDRRGDSNIEPVIRSVVQKEAPPIAQEASAGTVAQYNDSQKRGGLEQNNHFYQSLKRTA